ncbi:12427_t:CDS:2 [Funneliformis geosporum]|uniref:12427_t:CDS:1 n=1 Tax=Funneliformis geosporum TaxID=1117311 RepID=A0A9W4SHS8_9GLOM|nr:12427_t:CDS:2 [Funneliformis geosporum]
MIKVNETSTNTTETMITEDCQEGLTKEDSTNKKDNGQHTTDNILHSVSIDNEKRLSMSERVIQFIGGGHSNKRTKLKENNTENSTESENDTSILHSLDATTEDPFTLESFDTLIQQHAEKNKDFIIAKVTTVDPLDELKYYHSFYSGHHINKILFRTQPDQGLLHRMKAKNPLNNMNIIGDVHYYVVKAASVKKSQTFAKSSSMSATSRKTLAVKEEGVSIVATSSLDKTEEGDFTINVDDVISIADNLHSAPPSIWNFNNEEEVVVAIEMNSHSSKNVKNKRWSADYSIKSPPKAFTSDNNNSSTSGNLEKLLSSIKIKNYNNSNNNNNKDSQSSKEFSISFPKNDVNTNPSSSLENESILSPTTTVTHIDVGDNSIHYKATFYATDDDFLMRSTVRQFFKSNALDPVDAQLFTINSPHNVSTTINTTPPSARLERMVTNNGTEFFDSTSSPSHSRRNSQSNHVNTSRWWRTIHNLRMNKGLKWLVLMYMVFGFLLIRFVVNETYAYLMAFLLMLCLFLVFCVGSGVGIWGR